MASIKTINPKAELARSYQALSVSITAARGLQDVVSSNLGPKGTTKMLVNGGGDIKITKDGKVLLDEMQIQHPTASLIARTASAQDEITGDGTTSNIVLIGELLRQADLFISEGSHPRTIAKGFELASQKALEVLDKLAVRMTKVERETLVCVARTSLRTKLPLIGADGMADIVVDAVQAIREADPYKGIDLHMVEIMEMKHQTESDTRLVKGIVMDHGGRHPNMPKIVKDAYILTCNASLEYEKSEINSGFFYKTSEDRDKMVKAERQFTDEKVMKIIELKRKVCEKSNKGFVVVNQKGIDPISLDMLSREGILALRRAKRRNMERLVKACGGISMNSLDELTPECLGHAGSVVEYTLNDEKFTFVEDCKNPTSVTILLKAPFKHSLTQMKDAVRDGLRGVKNAIDDAAFVPGAGAFEIAAHHALMQYKNTIDSKEQLGIQAFAQALLVIPRTLSRNAGLDHQEVIVKLLAEHAKTGSAIGVDLSTGDAINPQSMGIMDNLIVKTQLIDSCTSVASSLLLVDEILRAGNPSAGKPQDGSGPGGPGGPGGMMPPMM